MAAAAGLYHNHYSLPTNMSLEARPFPVRTPNRRHRVVPTLLCADTNLCQHYFVPRGTAPLRRTPPNLQLYYFEADTTLCQTTLCQHYFVPTLLCANATLCQRYFVPTLFCTNITLCRRHLQARAGGSQQSKPQRTFCANTTLCQHYFVPALLCANATLCQHYFVPTPSADKSRGTAAE